MNNTIDGLDDLSNADFSVKEKSHPFLRQLGEVVGWIFLLVGFILAMAYFAPPQSSAEADLFKAECQEKGVAP